MLLAQPDLALCSRCGQPHRWAPLPPGLLARCVRCDAVLARGHRVSGQALLALHLGAALLMLIVALAPLIEVELAGSSVSLSLPQAVAYAWRKDDPFIALLCAYTALIVPAATIALRLYLLAPWVVERRHPPGFAPVLRALHRLQPWNTQEVMTVAALLSLVRLQGLADAAPGLGLVALFALSLTQAAVASAGLQHLWWQADAAAAAAAAATRPA